MQAARERAMWGESGLCCLLPQWLQSELDDGDHGHIDGGDDDVDGDHGDDCYLNVKVKVSYDDDTMLMVVMMMLMMMVVFIMLCAIF